MKLISRPLQLIAFSGLVLLGTIHSAQAMPQAPQSKPSNLGNSASIGTLEAMPDPQSGLVPVPAPMGVNVITLPEATSEFSPLERALNNLSGALDRSIQPALFDNRPNKAPGFLRTDL